MCWVTTFISLLGLYSVYAANPVMPSGRYKGQELDVTVRRSLNLVQVVGNTAVVDNFRFDGQFWRAEIPLDGIGRVIGQSFNFSPNETNRFVNHVQTRFSLLPGYSVVLYPLEGQGFSPVRLVTDFVYSVEVVSPRGVEWNVRDALLGNFVNGHRLVALEDVVKEKIDHYKYTVHQTLVAPLSLEQKRNLLLAALQNGTTAGLSQPYYLCRLSGSTRNCTSESFRLLDLVVPSNVVARNLWRLPLAPRTYLRLRRLYGGDLITLNEEFNRSPKTCVEAIEQTPLSDRPPSAE